MCRTLILFHLTILVLFGHVTANKLSDNKVPAIFLDEKIKQLTNLKDLENSLTTQKSSNTSSNYYLIINILKDLNLLGHYLNKQNLTGTSLEFNQTRIRSEPEGPETYMTKLSVFYSSRDNLTCTNIPNNVATVKCIDNILENKLKIKLNNLYDIKLQPLLVEGNKLKCPLMTEEFKTKEFNCYLPTKGASSRRKLVWKLLLVRSNKSPNVEPRSSRNFNESITSLEDRSLNEETTQVDNEVQSHLKEDQVKEDLLNISQPIDNFLTFVTNNKIILSITLIFVVGLTVLANTVLCLIVRKSRIKPLSIKTMSLNNRLLQNYLDVSLISDGKISSTSISKATNADKLNRNQRKEGPTPLRSSTSVEQNYATSSKHSPVGSQKNLSNFHLDDTNKFTSNEEDLGPSTNPYNSLSCLTVSEKVVSPCETKSKKLKYSVSSVGIQADLPSRDYCFRTQSMHRHTATSSSPIYRKNYEDAESQIICIEMDRNNTTMNQTISEDYISVADLYQLANKHLDQSASIKVNDYSAFKNSLNFQLQAAKAAALAENMAVNETFNEQVESTNIGVPTRMSTSIISINKKTTNVVACSRRSSSRLVQSGQSSIDEESEQSVSSTSSIAPYSSSSQFLEAGHTTHEEEEEDDGKEVNNSSREQASLWNNQSNGLKNTGWTTLNETEQTEASKHLDIDHSFHSPSTSSKNMFLNDLYIAIDGSELSRLKAVTPMESNRPNESIEPRDEITFLTRIQDSSMNSIYNTKNKLAEREIETDSPSLEKNGTENWTSVSVSSPSVSSLNETEVKRIVCDEMSKMLLQKRNSVLESRMKYGENRPVKIIQNSCQQYQKLYNLNKNKMITKNL